MQTENMILYGLWFGESKPFMGGFTKPLVNTLKDIETNGIDFDYNGQTHNSKCFLICGTADLPAKSIVMNCNQFNGQYSCLRCMHSGETYRTSKGGTVRTFPYNSSEPDPEKRTTQECINNAVTAIQNGTVVNGIKGPSFLMALKYYDFVKSSSIDYMHGVLLGITKLLINLWTNGSNNCITPDDLKRSQTMLSYFVHMFTALYGQRYMTLNMHSLLHLPECVEDLGPMWVYSCFPYENANGLLTKLFHGTQNIELQIISSLSIVQNMPSLLCNIEDPVHKAFAEKMQNVSENSKKYTGTLTGSVPVGCKMKMHLSDEVYSKLITTVKFKPSKCLCFRRISLRGFTIHSLEYSRVSVRNTYTVKYFEPERKSLCYGSILYYILAKKCECLDDLCSCDSSLVAVMHRYEETKTSIVKPNFLSVKANHIKVTKKTCFLCVVDTSKIMSVMVNVRIDDIGNYFLCEVPNLKESD
ncbi:Hypothetical predicted protein [Mytilus galloprovincialis]|uniref:DUF4218 domain-containing protein n=1 Tax=Mytilus galloprovincialis TaxID=29158 RepID=A0A8B6G5B2_MYTGA|nr:Hypothetical predicted protein [Mytilus galloprovincialis]